MTTVTHLPETNDGVVTSWLPVTSAWFPVSECSSAFYTEGGPSGLALAFDPYYGLAVDNRLTCLPPAVTTWWNPAQQTPIQTVISLGPLVCPSLYTTASTSVVDSMSTFIACCPSSYTFLSIFHPGVQATPGECSSPLTLGQPFTYMSNSAQTWVLMSTIIQSAKASVLGIPVNGYIFASATISSSSTSSMTPAPAATSFSSLSTASPSATLAASTSELSSGTKVGIAVGVVLAVIGICCLLGAIFIVRRRSRRALTSSLINGDTASRNPPKATGRDILTPNPTKHEMGYDDVYEMSATPGAYR